MTFYCNTCGKMREIFAEHCNLSGEQYEVINGRLINLVSDIQMLEEKSEELTLADAEKAEAELIVIFEFLLNTKELTLEEYNALCNMVVEMDDAARKAATV